MSLQIVEAGVLSQLQDAGRFGQHRLGLTTGGPMDRQAYDYCNRLLGNAGAATVIEVSIGGLQMGALNDTFICITGADMSPHIDGVPQPLWEVIPLRRGAQLTLGYARRGCRAYIGVVGGFQIEPVFGSAATVVREGLGGLNGGALKNGDTLPCSTVREHQRLRLPLRNRPGYHNQLTVRVVPGYQQKQFDRQQQRLFFSQVYSVSERSDRMGYRLEGAPVSCAEEALLSEGICYGAIQIPPDGQPIVLLNDRQTIGGYPKIGTALSIDAAALSQLTAGGRVHFVPITAGCAQRAVRLANLQIHATPLQRCQS